MQGGAGLFAHFPCIFTCFGGTISFQPEKKVLFSRHYLAFKYTRRLQIIIYSFSISYQIIFYFNFCVFYSNNYKNIIIFYKFRLNNLFIVIYLFPFTF